MNWRGPWTITALGIEWRYGWFDIAFVVGLPTLLAAVALTLRALR